MNTIHAQTKSGQYNMCNIAVGSKQLEIHKDIAILAYSNTISQGSIIMNHSAWHLIHTKPRQEIEAKRQLERQGYTVYLPLLLKAKSKDGKQISAQLPFFPRYLFIHLTSGIDDWGPIRSTRGVSNLVRFGANVACIPEELIREIQARAGDDGYHHEDPQKLNQGDKINIIDGPLSGYEAIFQARHGKDRALILLDIIGKASKTEVPLASVVKDG